MENIIEIKPLLAVLTDIRKAMVAAERKHQSYIDKVQPHYRDSARNLIHYLALRSFDLRDIQWQLSSLGMSSLGHSERYTMVNLQNILFLLRLLNGGASALKGGGESGLDVNYPRGKRQLDANTLAVFGPEEFPGQTRIMVTLPSEAATNYQLVKDLAVAGMDVARINCSHDDEAAWLKMIEHVQLAKLETSRPILLYMDLEGPKLRTGYIPPRISRKKGKEKRGYLRLRQGDTLYLVKEELPAVLPEFNKQDKLLSPGQISVTLPDIFTDVKAGQHIWFDDGKIGGLIELATPERIEVLITHVTDGESRLYAEKGINLPDTRLHLPALTAKDRDNLELIAQHADLVGFSFVRRPSDVTELQAELSRLKAEDLGIILKIETRETFENLPALLMTAMRSPRVGAMIARGDLAVELGFLRIAEVQEQILWLCEAAHIPTIWATQILETLVKKGSATRAEISDAVLSVRAECAMLNKGPFILDGVHLLHDIDRRMASHQVKKRSAMRPLNVARLFLGLDEK